jgi:hypothetical protein
MQASRLSTILILSPLPFLACQGVTEREAGDAVRESVEASWEEWLARSSTPLDFDGFMDLFVHDSTLVYVNSGRTWVGWDSVAAWHRRGWETWDSAHFSLGQIQTAVLGPSAAVLSSDGDFFIRMSSGSEFTGSYAATAVWRMTPSGWKIVQLHESFPN